MKKEKSKWYWWLLSPTYKYAEFKKQKMIEKNNSKSALSSALKTYNRRYFYSSIIICIISWMLVSVGYWLNGNDKGFYNVPIIKYIFTIAVIFICWVFLLSRAIEIFKAFLDDAIEKFDGKDSVSDLTYGDRLRLAYKSYL